MERRAYKRINEKELQCREFYEVLIEALRYVAERCGYSLSVHGSLARDIDLIACPWREHAIGPHRLIAHLRAAVTTIIGVARVRDVDKAMGQPEKKPCGRLAWSFYLTYKDDGPYLDISVMPQGAPLDLNTSADTKPPGTTEADGGVGAPNREVQN